MYGGKTAHALNVLTRLLLPVLILHAARRRSHLVTTTACHIKPPTEEDLARHPLFTKWPLKALKKLMTHATIVQYDAGRSVAFAGEPERTASVFWVMSGSLTQVPTKEEITMCASENPTLDAMTAPKTGPSVFPAFFDMKKSTAAPLTALQESVVRHLRVYTTRDLVDAEVLLLGERRSHAVRSRTAVVLLEFPFRALRAELRCMNPADSAGTLAIVKVLEQQWLATADQKPNPLSIIAANPVLRGLSQESLHLVCSRLQPRIFCKGERICEDSYTADTVSFLWRGEAAAYGSSTRRQTLNQSGAGIGVNSFAFNELPEDFHECRLIKAKSLCILWSISLSLMNELCQDGDRVNCSRFAARAIGSLGALDVAGSLRQVHSFSQLSDPALRYLAGALKLRVHWPGECVVAAHRPSARGIIVVAGRCHARTADQERIEVRRGDALYFCEALTNSPASQSIFADTSSIVLHGYSAILLDVLETRCTECKLEHILDLASEYLERINASRSIVHVAQERAAHNVWKHRQAERMTARAELGVPEKEMNLSAGDSLPVERCVENHVYTSLALHLDYLHRGDIERTRYEFFHDLKEGPATAADSDPSGGGCSRAPGCFTLDESGDPVYVGEGVPLLGPPSRTSTSDPDRLWSMLTASPPPLKEPPLSPAMSVIAPSPPPGLSSRPACRPPEKRPSKFSLRVPVTTNGPAAFRSVRPGVCAMRRTVEEMRDVADGLNTKAEYHRMMRKKGW